MPLLYGWIKTEDLKMSRLFLSKNTEAKVIATMWEMGCESLNPEDFEALETLIANMCKTRSIDRKTLGIELAVISGKKNHYSHCRTNDTPAVLPGPCNCEAV